MQMLFQAHQYVVLPHILHYFDFVMQTDNKKILAVPAEVVSVLAVGWRRKLWLESFFNRDGH